MVNVTALAVSGAGGAAEAQGGAQAAGGKALTGKEYGGAGESQAEGKPGGRPVAAARLLEEALEGRQGEGAEGAGNRVDTAAKLALGVTCKKTGKTE